VSVFAERASVYIESLKAGPFRKAFQYHGSRSVKALRNVRAQVRLNKPFLVPFTLIKRFIVSPAFSLL
jgi:hypothetical protein